MATIKCQKCNSLLIAQEGKEEITCEFCGTVQPLPPAETNNDLSVEALQLERHYEKLVQKARTYRDIKVLTETADEFYRLGTYKDSLQMAEYCLDRAAEEEQKRIEEAKIQEAEEQIRRKRRKKHQIKMAFIYSLIAALVIAFVVIMSQVEIKTYTAGMSFR